MLFKKHCYRNKEQTIGWRKCLHSTHISKGLLSKIFKELLWLNDKNKMEKKIIKDLSAKKYVYGLPISMSKDVVAVQSLSCDSASPWLQHSRLLCPPRSSAVCSSSCPLSLSSYLTISSSAAPFSFCFQFSPVSGSFPMSRLFASGGQSIGASATVLPVNTQGWFPLDWLVWSPCSPRNSPEMYTIFIH